MFRHSHYTIPAGSWVQLKFDTSEDNSLGILLAFAYQALLESSDFNKPDYSGDKEFCFTYKEDCYKATHDYGQVRFFIQTKEETTHIYKPVQY